MTMSTAVLMWRRASDSAFRGTVTIKPTSRRRARRKEEEESIQLCPSVFLGPAYVCALHKLPYERVKDDDG